MRCKDCSQVRGYTRASFGRQTLAAFPWGAAWCCPCDHEGTPEFLGDAWGPCCCSSTESTAPPWGRRRYEAGPCQATEQRFGSHGPMTITETLWQRFLAGMAKSKSETIFSLADGAGGTRGGTLGGCGGLGLLAGGQRERPRWTSRRRRKFGTWSPARSSPFRSIAAWHSSLQARFTSLGDFL